MEAELAIIAAFGFIPLIIGIVYFFRSRAHTRVTNLLEKIIERGDVVTPETVKALGIRPGTPHADLKTGMILVAIALAFILFGRAIPDDEAHTVMAGLAMFPLLVGLAFIIFWYFFGRKSISE